MNRHSLARDVTAITVMMIAFTTFQGVVISLMPLGLAGLGTGKAVIGGIISIPGVFAILFGPPVARLGNTRLRKVLICTGFILCLAASWFYGRADGAAGYIVPQALNGIANTMFWSLVLATSFQLIRGPRQHAVQSLITAAQGIGFFIGPIVSGYLSGSKGVDGFSLAIGASVIGFIAALFLSPASGLEPLPRVPEDLCGS